MKTGVRIGSDLLIGFRTLLSLTNPRIGWHFAAPTTAGSPVARCGQQRYKTPAALTNR
jgi:hypothetical protein